MKEDHIMILNQLGIFGWKEADENLVLASLLTGERKRWASRYVRGYGLSARFLLCRKPCLATPRKRAEAGCFRGSRICRPV